MLQNTIRNVVLNILIVHIYINEGYVILIPIEKLIFMKKSLTDIISTLDINLDFGHIRKDTIIYRNERAEFLAIGATHLQALCWLEKCFIPRKTVKEWNSECLTSKYGGWTLFCL